MSFFLKQFNDVNNPRKTIGPLLEYRVTLRQPMMGTDNVRQRERWIVLEEFSPYVGPLEGVEIVAHTLSPTEMVSPTAVQSSSSSTKHGPSRSASPAPSAPTGGAQVTRQLSTKSTASVSQRPVSTVSNASQQSTNLSDQLYMHIMRFDKYYIHLDFTFFRLC